MLVQMDVRSILSAGFRQIWKFLLVFVPVMLIGLLYLITSTKYYESSAKLLVKFGEDARPEMSLDGRMAGLSAEEKRGLVQSNVNILTSRDLAELVVDKTKLETIYPKLADLSISDEKKREAAVKTFIKDVTIHTDSAAGIIGVSFSNPNAKVAKDVLADLIDLFIQKQAEIYGNPQMDVLREQADSATARLGKASRELNDFKTETGIASIDEELTLLLQQRGDLVGYLSRRTTDSQPESAAASETSDTVTGPGQRKVVAPLPARIAKSGDNSRFPVVEDIQKKIDDLRSKEAELLLTYNPNSMTVKNIRRNIAIETAALNKSLEALDQQINDLDAQIAQKQEYRSKYDDLIREVDLSNEGVKTAQARLQVAEVNNDLNQRKITRISVIEEPVQAYSATKPKKSLVLALCILIGAAFGAALCMGTEILDSTFSRPEQLASELKRPVLASFAHYSAKTRRAMTVPPKVYQWQEKFENVTGLKTPKIVQKPAVSSNAKLSANELTSLYQSIESHVAQKQCRVVHIASCHNGEGATTVAHELAQIASGRLNQSVLFIGRENYLPATSALPPRVAASVLDVALGNAKAKDAVSGVETGGAVLSYAYLTKDGKYDGVIANADKIAQVIDELKQSFSMIIIATPGIISNPVGVSVSRMADGVVFVVEAERTRSPVVKQATQLLKESGANLIGLVLNKQLYYIPSWLYSRL